MNNSKMTTASVILAGALASSNVSADNSKPPILEGNLSNETVTIYTDKTSLNIAEVVADKKSGVLYSTWCAENPDACKRLGEIKKEEKNSKIELAEAPKNIDLIVNGKTFGLGLDTKNVYGEVTSNFDDELGAGLAYKDESGLVAGGSVAGKENVGLQTGVGAGFVKNFDSSYVGAGLKYTEFNAKGIYADSNSVKAKVMGAYEVAPGLFAEAGVSYKTVSADTYDRESRVEGNLGIAYMTPDYTLRVSSTINEVDNRVMATLSFPIGGKNKVSAANLGQSSMARFVADSSFDKGMVKVKKVPVVVTTPEVPLPAQVVSISAMVGAVSVGSTENISAPNGPGGPAIVALSVNSPYTLSSSSLSFNPLPFPQSESQTVNILHNGNIVGTKTITVSWY
ncbi:MAG: hypothetical protein PHV23_00030 [Candidatus Gracilibacteria bacterium]|nr:hypothetical protein [Candidatus Gracilibacteria bacterium]